MTAAPVPSYPEPTPDERRAWYFTKRDARRRAAYRNSLPQGLGRLRELLADAPSSWHAEVIRARIEQVRAQNRHHNRVHRAAYNAATSARMLARTPEELARDQAEFYPTGRAACRTCGKTLPIAEFEPAPHKRRGVQNYCRGCWEPDHA
jgi:hypothetical protein